MDGSLALPLLPFTHPVARSEANRNDPESSYIFFTPPTKTQQMLDLLFPAQFFFLQNVLGLSLAATYGLEVLCIFVRPPQTAIFLFCISFSWDGLDSCLLYNVMNLHPQFIRQSVYQI